MVTEILPYRGVEHQPFEMGDSSRAALLIHGFPGTPNEVRGIANALADDGWHVRGILLPGFGPNIAQLEQYNRHDWVDAAMQAWKEIISDYSPSILIGYSMGAAIAMQVASRFPPDRLILAAPFWRFPGFLPALLPIINLFSLKIRPFRKADFSDGRVRELFDRILPDVEIDDPVLQETIRNEFVLPIKSLSEVVRLGKDAYRVADNLSIPTLILQGREDVLVKPEQTEILAARFPDGKVQITLLDSSHDLLAECCEQKDLVYRLIASFLEDIGGR